MKIEYSASFKRRCCGLLTHLLPRDRTARLTMTTLIRWLAQGFAAYVAIE